MTWLLSAAPSVEPAQAVLLNYGALGVLGLAALGFFIVACRYLVKQIEAANSRADRIAAEKDQLTKDLMKDVIPVLTQAVEAVAEYVDLQRSERRNRR